MRWNQATTSCGFWTLPLSRSSCVSRRRERERQLVMHAAHRIGDHLIFVDDEKLRPVAPQKTRALSFQGGDENLRAEIQRQIAGRDADIPAARAPFREFVIGQRARRHRENGLPFQRRIKQLEDVGLPRTGRRLDDDVFPIAQRPDGLLLPEIGDHQIDFESLRHRAKLMGSAQASTTTTSRA